MNILAVDSSANACSVALCQDETLIAQYFLNSGLTHSKTLLPIVSRALKESEITLQEIDLLAVAAGPGSFTGLRIGIAAVKGLSWASDIPCVACSTLGSMAWQLAHLEGYTVVTVMDARRNQVYRAIFLIEGGAPKRLCPDGAISILELEQELAHIPGQKIFVGDGAKLCQQQIPEVALPPAHLLLQQAWGVAQEGIKNKENAQISHDLVPEYHRMSQAERERAKAEGNAH